jgi:hypothetical protein
MADLAPYPRTPDEASAQSLARHCTYMAQLNYHQATNLNSPDAAPGAVSSYSVAKLLRALHDLNPQAADKAARDLWLDWEIGDLGAEIARWLRDYGIDLNQVNEIAAAHLATEETATS